MKPGRLHATPDLMALLCLISGVVREAAARDVLMPLLLVGTYCPPLLHALRIWISAEATYATTEFEYELYCEEDGEGGCDEIRPGWISREGPVLLWRHVDRFGRALLIPIQWYWMVRAVPRPQAGGVWVPRLLLSHLSLFRFFADGLAATKNHAYFVTISK